MNYYKSLRPDELGISSEEEAEELEFELEVRFGEFTPKDRKTWLQQNAYLDHFSRTGTVTSAARRAGVTVYKAQRWKYDNVLGFTRRLEVATLTFNDRLKQKALLRASDPKAPATLLIELLRAYIPETFSRNGHKCDTSKSEELLRHFREDARREQAAGHPTLRKLAEGATNSPSSPNLSPDGGKIQRGGALHTAPHAHWPSPDDHPPLDSVEVPSVEDPTNDRHTGGGTSPRTPIRGRYPEEVPAGSSAPIQTQSTPPPDANEGPHHHDYPPLDTAESNLSPAGEEIQRGGPSRAERRERLRQERKTEKKNTFTLVRF